MFFSPKQVAESLGVSGSTVRRYAAIFGDLLSVYANPGDGKRRSFTSTDVDTLRLIQSLFGAGLSEQETRIQLEIHQQTAASSHDAAGSEDRSSTDQALAALADQKPLLDAQARLIAEQAERIGRLEASFERLSQEVQALKAGANR